MALMPQISSQCTCSIVWLGVRATVKAVDLGSGVEVLVLGSADRTSLVVMSGNWVWLSL